MILCHRSKVFHRTFRQQTRQLAFHLLAFHLLPFHRRQELLALEFRRGLLPRQELASLRSIWALRPSSQVYCRLVRQTNHLRLWWKVLQQVLQLVSHRLVFLQWEFLLVILSLRERKDHLR